MGFDASIVVPSASAIITAIISYFATVGTAYRQRRLLADMDVYDRLTMYYRLGQLDAKEQEAFMYLRATIGAQIRKLYLYDYDRMLRWIRVSGGVAVVLTAIFAVAVNDVLLSTCVGAVLGLIAPFVGAMLFRLKTKRRNEALTSLAEGPWSDAEYDKRDAGKTCVDESIHADENADICEETLHS